MFVDAGRGSYWVADGLAKYFESKILLAIRITSFSGIETEIPECFEGLIPDMMSFFRVAIDPSQRGNDDPSVRTGTCICYVEVDQSETKDGTTSI